MSGNGRHADDLRRVALDGTEYHCQAYGPNSRGLCFVGEEDPCTSRRICESVMVRERLILWTRLLALREAGDETAEAILLMTDEPRELLNGDLWADRREAPGSGD